MQCKAWPQSSVPSSTIPWGDTCLPSTEHSPDKHPGRPLASVTLLSAPQLPNHLPALHSFTAPAQFPHTSSFGGLPHSPLFLYTTDLVKYQPGLHLGKVHLGYSTEMSTAGTGTPRADSPRTGSHEADIPGMEDSHGLSSLRAGHPGKGLPAASLPTHTIPIHGSKQQNTAIHLATC